MPSRIKIKRLRPKWVFINCPFDPIYTPLLRAVCFAIMACGYVPKCALEFSDSGAVRVTSIADMIAQCSRSIHDISRVQLSAGTALPRFNMPFELGIDVGLRLEGEEIQRARRTLIMDSIAHRYGATLSDISGQDIEIHGDSVPQVIRVVRDWLAANHRGKKRPPGGAAILQDYEVYTQIAHDIAANLRLGPHEDLGHIDFLHVVRIALPLIAAARLNTA